MTGKVSAIGLLETSTAANDAIAAEALHFLTGGKEVNKIVTPKKPEESERKVPTKNVKVNITKAITKTTTATPAIQEANNGTAVLTKGPKQIGAANMKVATTMTTTKPLNSKTTISTTPTIDPTTTTTNATKITNNNSDNASKKNKAGNDKVIIAAGEAAPGKAVKTKATTASAVTTSTVMSATLATSKAPTTTAVAKTTTTTSTDAFHKDKAHDSKKHHLNDEMISSTASSSHNLTKFATVSNLAQCLHDVDAELDDYIPSSAEVSEDDYSDYSDSDLSSFDGTLSANLSESMKKKLKQKHRKEKRQQKLAAGFDPHKKVKIDTSRKLYVKEEAPRYPLVATPRPLWKREKIVYDDDEDDDEDGEDEDSTTNTSSGNSEAEAASSDECSTSDDYGDDLRPPSAAVCNPVNTNSTNNNNSSAIIRMSTCSNDSGFEGGTAPSSPKRMLGKNLLQIFVDFQPKAE